MIITLIFYSLDISFGAIYFYFINEFSKLSIFSQNSKLFQEKIQYISRLYHLKSLGSYSKDHYFIAHQ